MVAVYLGKLVECLVTNLYLRESRPLPHHTFMVDMFIQSQHRTATLAGILASKFSLSDNFMQIQSPLYPRAIYKAKVTEFLVEASNRVRFLDFLCWLTKNFSSTKLCFSSSLIILSTFEICPATSDMKWKVTWWMLFISYYVMISSFQWTNAGYRRTSILQWTSFVSIYITIWVE